MKSVILVIIIGVSLLVGCSAQTSDKEVKNIVISYLDALETKDLSALVKYSNDIRFPNKDEQLEQYSSIDQEVTDAKIVELKRVNDTEYEVTIEFVSDGNLGKLTFPVQKKEEEWKIIVGQDF